MCFCFVFPPLAVQMLAEERFFTETYSGRAARLSTAKRLPLVSASCIIFSSILALIRLSVVLSDRMKICKRLQMVVSYMSLE